jgi:hypothetical protein
MSIHNTHEKQAQPIKDKSIIELAKENVHLLENPTLGHLEYSEKINEVTKHIVAICEDPLGYGKLDKYDCVTKEQTDKIVSTLEAKLKVINAETILPRYHYEKKICDK